MMTQLDTDLTRPIIGVFINNNKINKLVNGDDDFKSYPRIYEMARASKEANVTLYYFSTINWEQRTEDERLLGTYYDESDSIWKQRLFPIPDVLYDRGGGGKNTRDIAEHIRTIYNQRKVNSISYFSKWDVFNELKEFPETAHYLPDTKLFEKEEDIRDFFDKYERVYVKAVRGGRGRRVMRVVRLPDGGYQYSYFIDDLEGGIAANLDELLFVIEDFLKGRDFVLQQGIHLMKINDSNVDFRAELQRNGQGELEILGISARIGHHNSPITIHSSAYSLEEFFQLFSSYSDEEFHQLKTKIVDFLQVIYETLERVYGPFGEIGLDFSIDAFGKIWFIEPNAKTAKVSLQKAYDEKTFYKAHLNPLEYGKYVYKKMIENTIHPQETLRFDPILNRG